MDFLGIIFLIIVGFYLLGRVLRFAFRYWVAKKMTEFQQRGFGGFNGYGEQQQQRGENKKRAKEGEVKISRAQTAERRIRDDVGEYVEFDEVK